MWIIRAVGLECKGCRVSTSSDVEFEACSVGSLSIEGGVDRRPDGRVWLGRSEETLIDGCGETVGTAARRPGLFVVSEMMRETMAANIEAEVTTNEASFGIEADRGDAR